MSRELVTASVEIFHDQISGRLATENVMDGLGIVAAIAGKLEVVRDHRLLKISQPEATEINPRAIRWPKFESDLALVLTDRSFKADNDGSEVVDNYTHSVAGITMYQSSVSVINTNSRNVANVVAHEVGHLFGLKLKGSTVDALHPEHCVEPSCLMHWGQMPTIEKTPLPAATKTRRLLERVGLKEVEYEVKRVVPRQDFCDECSSDLEVTGKLRALDRQGIHVPRLS